MTAGAPGGRERRRRAPLGLLAALLAVLAACERGGTGPSAPPKSGGTPARADAPGAPAEGWPADTVLAVDGLPITAAEVDRVAGWIAALFPEDARASLRRKALNTVVLPRAATRVRYAEERAAALAELRADRAALTGTAGAPRPAPAGEAREGTWKQLGLDLWGPAGELEPGVWSEPLEGVGCLRLVRVDAVVPGVSAADRRYRVTVVERSYVPLLWDDASQNPVEQALDAARLEIVDPDWADVVPFYWVHRMGGD